MAQLINKAINPKDESDSYALELMPCRSPKIKRVLKVRGRADIGGFSDPSSGTVSVPSGQSASERTIRYHEALHAQHTPKSSTPKDMLDQALEDSRLHRYASRSATSSCQQARRDELTTALRELRAIRKMTQCGISLRAPQSLATMRAKAILEAGDAKPAHRALLDEVCSLIGPHAGRDMDRALTALADSDGDTNGSPWSKARGYVGQYFTHDFDSTQSPKPKPSKSQSDTGKSERPQASTKSSSDSDDDSSPKPNEDSSSTDSDEDDSEDSDSDTPGEDSDSPSSPSDNEEDDEDEDSPSEPVAPIEPIAKRRTPKARTANPDEYTADLTPACDVKAFKEMNEHVPLKLYIRRLDMDINRVKLDLGRRELLPVMAGSRINPAKLAVAKTTPGVRAFQRKVNQGGSGTILIDASSSMRIPERVLIDFCEKAPALTLAFYNAPSDHVREGTIFIYAANGYRANLSNLYSLKFLKGYGHGNVIDYHAMAWLIKQPGPHYLVTDCEWTGLWTSASEQLFRKLHNSKQIELVPSLEAMAYVMDARKRHSPKSTSVLVREYFKRINPRLTDDRLDYLLKEGKA